MADVAHRAGVSISTVSHVLNKTRTVAPETIQAVKDAIDELGFTPNVLARALARARTSTIGVALSAITNIYFGEVVHGMQAECIRHGYFLFLTDTADQPEHQLEVIRALHERRVDGMVLAHVPDPDNRAVRYLQKHKIPVVFVDRAIDSGFDQVLVENRKATQSLVAHLAGHGHKRIGLVSGIQGLATTVERIEGYRAGLKDAGLPFDERFLECGESEMEPAHQAVLRLMKLSKPPTAIISANNKMTLGVVRALKSIGRRIPKDIAIAAFDDFEWADSFDPTLTALAQPCQEMGAHAIKLLLRRIKTPQRKPVTLVLEPELRIRHSCGC
jgi:LacI family transcriptional regulator